MGEYPENWGEIALAIKRRAEWRCEHCGRPHDPVAGYCLTVHHLDLNKSNCDRENLVALCQRCHLSIQARYRPGQMWLLDAPAWAVDRGLAASSPASIASEAADQEKSSTR